METKNRYTKDGFKSILNKIELIKDLNSRLKYIDSVKQQYSEIFFPKRKIRLLSEVHDKIIEDFKKWVCIKADETANRLRVADKKSIEDIRNIDSYLRWEGTIEQLNYLIINLIKKGFIKEKEENIEKIINNHFYVEGYKNKKDEKIMRLKWNKCIPDLIRLFEKLSDNELFDVNILKRHEKLACHFLNKNGKDIEGEEIRKKTSLYKAKDNYKKDRFEVLDYIICQVINDI